MIIRSFITNKKQFLVLVTFIVPIIIIPLIVAGYFIAQKNAGADKIEPIPVDAELGFNTLYNAKPNSTQATPASGVIAGKYIVMTGSSVIEKMASQSTSSAPLNLSPTQIAKDTPLAKTLLNTQAAVKQEIENGVVTLTKSDSRAVVDRKFDGAVFNGFSVSNLSDTAKESLKASGYIVEPVKKVTVVLDVSVPEIFASNVWQIKDPANKFANGQGIKIGIIDTGIDYTHADLGSCTKAQVTSGQCAKVIGGYNFISKTNDPMDNNGHGTHVAATAAGDGSLKGVAPKALIYSYKVFDSSGAGNSSDIIAAIEKSIDPNGDGNFADRLDVINLSICDGTGNADDFMSKAVDKASSFGVTVVVAAGNNSNNGTAPGTLTSPGTARSAITVGAYSKGTKTPASFTSRGPAGTGNSSLVMKPDITAPGTDICAAEWAASYSWHRCKDNTHVSLAGTSMSTPHVTGAAALIKQLNPSWTPERIKQSLINTATTPESGGVKGTLMTIGAGQVNVLAAANAYGANTAAPNGFPIIQLDDAPLNPDGTRGYVALNGKVTGAYQTITVSYISANTIPVLSSWKKLYTRTVSNPRTTVINGNTYYMLEERAATEAMLEGPYIFRLDVTNAANQTSRVYSYQKVSHANYRTVSPGSSVSTGQKIDLTVATPNYHDFDCNNTLNEADVTILQNFATSNAVITNELIIDKAKICVKFADYLNDLLQRGKNKIPVEEIAAMRTEITSNPVSYSYRLNGAPQWTGVPAGLLDATNLAAGKYDIRVQYTFNNVKIVIRYYEITMLANAQPTKIYVPDRSTSLGSYTVFKGYLYKTNNAVVSGKTLEISLNDKIIGSVATDIGGLAQLEKYLMPADWIAGDYIIKYRWVGDGGYAASIGTGKLTLGKEKGYTWVGDRTGARNDTVEIRSLVRYSAGTPVAGVTVEYYMDNVAIGTAVSGADGWVSFKYKVPASTTIKKHTITVKVPSSEKISSPDSSAFINVVR